MIRWGKLIVVFVFWQACFSLQSAYARSDALFDLRNGFWINLHHFLYAQALSQSTTANARWISSAQEAIKKARCDRFDSA